MAKGNTKAWTPERRRKLKRTLKAKRKAKELGLTLEQYRTRRSTIANPGHSTEVPPIINGLDNLVDRSEDIQVTIPISRACAVEVMGLLAKALLNR
jgi:hypothetical protein